MLVLLAVVLTTATFISRGSIKVDLPKASSEAQKIEEPKEIVLTQKGEIYFEEKLISLDELISRLVSVPKEATLIISGDQNMDYKYFVSVMDRLTTGGYTNLSIATKKE